MSSATLINCFEVPDDQDEQFLDLWSRADELLRSQGGYLTTRLHKALMPGSRYRYINIAELDSVETWQAVITSPEFEAITGQMQQYNPAPGLFTVAAAHTRQEQPAAR